MKKKFFAILVAILLIISTSYVFAANEIKDSADKAGTTVRDAANNVGNAVKDTANAIGAGVHDAGNTLRNDGNNAVGKTNMDNGNYDTTRTATTRTNANSSFLGMSSNTWTWFIIAIAALAIVGLVWYYAMQNKNEYDNNH